MSETLYSERIRALAHSQAAKDRIIAAGHERTTRDLMIRLARDPESIVREALAANPSACVDALKRLADDDHWTVRRLVASNPSAPADVLSKLISDPQPEVAHAAAVNPGLPDAEALRIAKGVRSLLPLQMTLAKHSASPIVLEELAGHKNLKVLLLVARNPATPAKGLRKMAGKSSKTLRKEIIHHQNVTLEILDSFAGDTRWDIQELLANARERMIEVERKCREAACAEYEAGLEAGGVGYGGGL